MARKRFEMTTEWEKLSDINPKVLPLPDGTTQVIFRHPEASTGDIAIRLDSGRLGVWQDPDGSNTFLGWIPDGVAVSDFIYEVIDEYGDDICDENYDSITSD